MDNATTLDEARAFVTSNAIAILYLSRPDCGVCTVLKPKVAALAEAIGDVAMCYLDLDALPEAAGEYSVFTIPAILVYVDGREWVREARYVSLHDLESKIRRVHELRNG